MSFHYTQPLSITMAFGVILSILGCGPTVDLPELGLVTGKVTLQGSPLPDVEVSFVPDNGRPSYGRTDKEGKYELNYIRDAKGARIGRHVVSIDSTTIDNSKIAPVEIKAGPQVIDIDCQPRTPDPNQPTQADGP